MSKKFSIVFTLVPYSSSDVVFFCYPKRIMVVKRLAISSFKLATAKISKFVCTRNRPMNPRMWRIARYSEIWFWFWFYKWTIKQKGSSEQSPSHTECDSVSLILILIFIYLFRRTQRHADDCFLDWTNISNHLSDFP